MSVIFIVWFVSAQNKLTDIRLVVIQLYNNYTKLSYSKIVQEIFENLCISESRAWVKNTYINYVISNYV